MQVCEYVRVWGLGLSGGGWLRLGIAFGVKGLYREAGRHFGVDCWDGSAYGAFGRGALGGSHVSDQGGVRANLGI